MNGLKNTEEKKIKLDRETESIEQLIKTISSSLKLTYSSKSKVYTPDGVELTTDDLFFIKEDDILYYEPKGRLLRLTHNRR